MNKSVLPILAEGLIDPAAWELKPSHFLISETARTRCERAVLKRIAFWYPKAKTYRDGYMWLVKSAQEMREEGVEYALDTIWRAIRELVRREVLVTETHWHPYRVCVGRVLFIRPVADIIDDTKPKSIKKKYHAKAFSDDD
ncbi:MAG: hypothetical protein ABMA01_19015 [Chthoniobacteraceae bacterium]